jgi:phosphopantetheinyl transferase
MPRNLAMVRADHPPAGLAAVRIVSMRPDGRDTDATRFWQCARAEIGDAAGVAADDVRIVRRPSHAPECRIGTAAGPFLSHAHCAGAHVLAICAQAPVGVDVERPRPLTAPLPDIAAGLFHPHECGALGALPQGSAAAHALFWALWTRKEAIGKVLGVGLLGPLAAIDARPDSTNPDAPLPLPLPDGRGIWLKTLHLPDTALVGAVAALAPFRLTMAPIESRFGVA